MCTNAANFTHRDTEGKSDWECNECGRQDELVHTAWFTASRWTSRCRWIDAKGRWTWKLAKNVQWHRKTTSTSPSNWMSRETLSLWFCKNCCNQHVTWVQLVTRLHQSKAKLFLCPIQLVNVAWEQKTWRLELSTGRMWETFLAFRCHHPTGSVFHQTKAQFIRGLDTHGTRVNYNQLWCDVVILVLSLFAHSIQVL